MAEEELQSDTTYWKKLTIDSMEMCSLQWIWKIQRYGFWSMIVDI